MRASVRASERDAAATWLSPAQLGLFDSMTIADRRHGLDVVAALRRRGVADRDVLVAGLLHDAGKGEIGVGPRIAYSLGQAYGRWAWRWAAVLPGWDEALERLRTHPERSAALAVAAGCSQRTIDLIRNQEAPVDPTFGRLLHEADEAS
jgi:hypothetical protein